MKKTDQHKSLELDQYLDGADILYSHKDKKHFLLSLDAVINQSMGLAVIGSSEAVLTHYSRIITSRLRKEKTLRLSTFPPANTEDLLQKFNQLLSEMTIDQARQKPSADKPITLMLVNDANVVDPVQWTLLLQLLSDFPGINIRMVLFFNKAAWPAYDETLTLLGRNLYRWDIGTPSALEAKEFFSVTRGTIYERETALLLNNIGLGGVTKEAGIQIEADQLPLGDQQTQSIKEGQNTSSREAPILEEQGEGTKPNSFKQQRLLRALILVVVVGAAAFGVSDIKIGEHQLLLKSTDDQLQGEVLPSELFIPPAFPTSADIEEIAPIHVNQTSLEYDTSSDEQNPIVTSNQVSQNERAVLQSQKTIAKTALAPENAEPNGEKPDNKSEQNRIQRLKILPKQTFFVQHIVLKSDRAIVDYITQFPALSDARILPINSSGNKSFGIISGPFLSRGEAAEFTAGPGIPQEFWLWEAEQLEAWCQNNQTCDF